MHIHKLFDWTKNYLYSFFYPLTLAILTFCIWLTPGNWSYLPAAFFSLFSFLPLIGTKGKAYLPLFLFLIALSSQEVRLDQVNGPLLLAGISSLVSSFLFIFIYKKKMVLGKTFITSIILFITFALSYIYNMIVNQSYDFNSFAYIMMMMIVIIASVIIATILGREESLTYLSMTVALLALIIALESFTAIFSKHGFQYAGPDFSLGWANSISTPSTLLLCSLPFFSILINKKQYFYIIGELIVISGILLLSSYSAILCLTIIIFPMIFLTFRNEGKRYPYFILLSIVFTTAVLSCIISYDPIFNEHFIDAIRSINLCSSYPEGRKEIYLSAISEFIQSPVFGISIAGRFAEGVATFAQNTVLSTMVLGGSLGLIAYLSYIINLYVIILSKQSKEKLLFLLFVLIIQIIGLVDNSFYKLPVFLLLVISVSTYQMSNRPQDAVIYQSSYEIDHGNLLDRR